MPKRALTEGEITLARSIFSDSLDYSAIGVFDRGYAHLNMIGDMSYRGNIYLPDGYSDDFSKTSLARQRLFIHESVHVWQHQNRILNLAMSAFQEGVKHQFNYAKAYLFHLEPGKDLLDYGFEQQAAIIEEYFLRHHGGALMGRCLNRSGNIQLLLEEVLNKFLENPSYARHGRSLSRPFPQIGKLLAARSAAGKAAALPI